MSIPAIGAAGFVPMVAPQLPVSTPATATTTSATAASPATEGTTSVGAGQGAGGDFASMLAKGLDTVQGLQDKADGLAVQAATGDLSDVHDYTIAAGEAAVGTQLTAAVRNKALEAFNEIMRMQI